MQTERGETYRVLLRPRLRGIEGFITLRRFGVGARFAVFVRLGVHGGAVLGVLVGETERGEGPDAQGGGPGGAGDEG